MSGPFSHPLRVRYAECDAQGVVFNAHYLAYLDVGITELWRAAFGSYQEMLDRGIDLMVAETRLRFRAPARFDDELQVTLAIERLGTTSITVRDEIRRGEELIVDGVMRHVVVDRGSWRKAEIPDWLRQGLTPWVLPCCSG